jgi:Rrf2 family protein
LRDLRRAGLLCARQGADGGFRFKVPPDQITLAAVIRAIDGPLITIGEDRPSDVIYSDSAKLLTDVWVAARASLRVVLEGVTVADVASGALPEALSVLLDDPEAWQDH